MWSFASYGPRQKDMSMPIFPFFFFHDGIFFVYSTKIEKEKREHAKQHGMIRTEITGAEIAEEMEKERRLFQLQMCEVRTNFLFAYNFVSFIDLSCWQLKWRL